MSKKQRDEQTDKQTNNHTVHTIHISRLTNIVYANCQSTM